MKKLILFGLCIISIFAISQTTTVNNPVDTNLVNGVVNAATSVGQAALDAEQPIVKGVPNSVIGGFFTAVLWGLIHFFRKKKKVDGTNTGTGK
jgi:hypothetical protein